MVSRPSIPVEIVRDILGKSSHRCAVCGTPIPLELAHIIPWHESKKHNAEDLICLCANCHERADKEKWGEKILREYKLRPWAFRQYENEDHMPEPMTKLQLAINMELKDFDEKNQRWLQYAIASFLCISPNSVRIISVEKGSVKVTLKLPTESAGRLLQVYATKDADLVKQLTPQMLTDHTLTWLHLSDWHQGNPDSTQFDRETVRKELLKDIQARMTDEPALAQIDFIAFTGDAAFHGKKEEYDDAVRYLFDPLLAITHVPRERLFLVPGNHDLNLYGVQPKSYNEFSHPDDIKKWQAEPELRPSRLAPLTSYAQFAASFAQPPPDPAELAYCYHRAFDASGKKIGILGLNSAWLSGYHREGDKINDRGFLALGELQVAQALEAAATSDVLIALVHHPLDWLLEEDLNRVERLLYSCHFLLHGHIHKPAVSLGQGTYGEIVIIPAGACYDRRAAAELRYANAYNFVQVNFDTGRGCVYLRRWNDERNKWDFDSTTLPGERLGLYEFDLPKELGDGRHVSALASIEIAPAKVGEAPLAPAAGDWFQRHCLRGNPFPSNVTKESGIEWKSYLVPVVDEDKLSDWDGPCIVHGAKGSGKTAIRRALQARCAPEDRTSLRLAIAYTGADMDAALRLAPGGLESLLPEHHIHILLPKATNLLLQLLKNAPALDARWKTLENVPTWLLRYAQAREKGEAIPFTLGGTGTALALQEFLSTLQELGLSCLVLVDGIDEAQTIQVDTAQTAFVLKSILGFPWFRRCGIIWKFFIPDPVEEGLREETWLPKSEILWFPIRWDDRKLCAMLDARIQAASLISDKRNLSEFVEEQLRGQAGESDIYQRIIQSAQANPRAIIELTGDLISCAKQLEDPAGKITLELWQQAETGWQAKRQAADTPPILIVTPDQKQVRLGAKQVALRGQGYKLLEHLWKHKGAICSQQELMPLAGLASEVALQTAMNRLRNTLSAEWDYIGTERGVGYWLRPTAVKRERPKST